MRMRQLTIAAAALLISTQAFAQEWVEYSNKQDRFEVNFPGQPTVREFTYTSWLEAKLPARVYTVERGAEKYSVTFVDYTVAQQVHAEMAKNMKCSAGTPPTECTAAIAGTDSAAQGVGAWKYDVQGALDFASEAFLKRDAKVTYFAWATIDRIVGRQIQLTNPDQSRTFVEMHILENRLYIFEATVPPRAPEPALFQQSPRFLDGEGKPVRYPDNYINMYGIPEASPARQGTQAPRGGRGGAAGRGAPTP
jgi:hypothetical protein